MTDEEAAALGKKIGEALLGTCSYPEKELRNRDLNEGLTNNMAFCMGLDTTAMCCACCDWYCEPCELDERDYCSQCQEED